MAEDMEQAGNDGNGPTWEIVGPDEAGIVVIRWQAATSESPTQLPLGPVGAVAARMADWLGEIDFGDAVPDS